ncbi:MAG TPA: Gfo/Idh/MocA family oxidoreductase [Candidatus Acidoferrales bacterium]|nr:Gfo/Idh/MocA family oxidoreductase [Candidatus Acidoferrales bacterium]
MLKIGLIGFGYWGPNLARVISQVTQGQLAACCDADPQRLAKAAHQYPSARAFQDVDALLDSDVDAVAIATPIATHYDLARRALLRGKHVFVEKPLADSSVHALELDELARYARRALMTGHTFVYSPPVVKIKELIKSGALGEIKYLSFSRVNLGLYQKDVDVVWDLGVHDVSILLYWLEEAPIRACSFGRSCVQKRKRDVASLWFQFGSGAVAWCEVSWLSPQKMRRTCVVGTKNMVVYDDTEPSEKVKVYDRGVNARPPENFGEFQLTYRIGDIVVPTLSNMEPLQIEMEHFIHCAETGAMPRTDGKFGTAVVSAIELANSVKWSPDETMEEVAGVEARGAGG